MRYLTALVCGGLFGAGLWCSGMTDTTKVQGWLDLFGAWDPTLAFVFAGALPPMAVAWIIARRQTAALAGGPMPAPAQRRVGGEVIVGSLLFGAGWGLAGLCPGPAIASLTWGGWGGAAFLVAMLAGMVAAVPVRARLSRASGRTRPARV